MNTKTKEFISAVKSGKRGLLALFFCFFSLLSLEVGAATLTGRGVTGATGATFISGTPNLYILSTGDAVTFGLQFDSTPTYTAGTTTNATITIGASTAAGTYNTVFSTTLIWSRAITAGMSDVDGLTMPAQTVNSVKFGSTPQNFSVAAKTGTISGVDVYLVDTIAPTHTVTVDSVTSTSFTATLSAALVYGGRYEKLMMSTDGGTNWTDISDSVSGASVSKSGLSLGASGTLKFKVTDSIGRESGVTTYNYSTDTPPPTAPSIALTSDTGTSSTDKITSNGALTLTGVEAGAAVEYSLNGTSGWASTFTASNGANTVYARQTDAAGNVSAASAAFTFTLDTTAQTINAVALTASTGKVGNYLNAGDTATATVTFNDTVTVTGTPQLTFTIGATPVIANYASGSGSANLLFTYTILAAQADANGISFSANALALNAGSIVDTAGNAATLNHASVADNSAYLVDTTTPDAPTIALTSDTGTSSTDKITSNGALTLTGVEAGASVEYSLNGTSGWTASFTAASGANTVYARQTDEAGNVSAASAAFTFTLDTTAPLTPSNAAYISTDMGASSTDRITNTVVQTVTSELGAPLASDKLYGSVDNGTTWYDITWAASGTAISWGSCSLVDGSHNILFKVIDSAGNSSPATAANSLNAYTLDLTAPTTTVSNVHISADTGASSTDFVTNVAAQTVTATISAPVEAGGALYASSNGGASWSDVTSGVSGTAVTWSGVTLSDGTSSLQFKSLDLAGNAGSNSGITGYTLDLTGPTQTVSGVDISSDSGFSQVDFVTNTAAQTITATFSAPLAGTDILWGTVNGGIAWVDITSKVSGTTIIWNAATLVDVGSNSIIAFKVEELSGNAWTSGNTSYTLDAISPTQTISNVHISADTGTSSTDFITNVAAQTVTATISAPVEAGGALYASSNGGASWSDITSGVSGTAVTWSGVTLSDGTSSLQFKSLDLAGNAGSNSGVTGYTLDTTAPTTTVSGVDISNDTGASNTDFITNAAAQTITGTLSTNLLANETLKVSMDGGDTWTGINASVSGTAISYATTLTGNASMVFRIFDDAGNFGSYQGWTTIIFDTTPPALTVTTNSLSADAGTSASDFITNTATQTITATLSGALSAGDTIRGSVNGYTTKTDITTKVSGTTITWDGATLVSGTNDIVFRVRDAAGNDSANLGTKSYTLDTSAPTIIALYVHSSNGKVGNYLNAGDYFYTAATFSEPVSVSGTPQVGVTVGSTVYQSNYFLTISPEIYFVHTITAGENDSDGVSFQANAITLNGGSVIDTAGNGANLAHALVADNAGYLIDTATPAAPTIALTSDTGTSSTDKITSSGALTLTGVEAGATVEYSLNGTSGWTASFTAASGANTVYARQTDAAGNVSAASTAFTFTLDTTAPLVPSNAAYISTDTGASSTDRVTNTTIQTVTSELGAPLTSDKLYGSVDNGTTWYDITWAASGTSISWGSCSLVEGTHNILFKVMDAAGNSSPATTANSLNAYTLDLTGPTQTVSGVDIATDSGFSQTDFVTNISAQTITATLSAPLSGTDILRGTVNGGNTWIDITSKVSGTTINWNVATLVDAGSNSIIAFKVEELSGNAWTSGNTSYTLDTISPTQAVSNVHISADTGASSTDFITNVAAQTVTATISAPVEAGGALYASSNGGASWSDITSGVSGTAVTWSGVTLSAGTSSLQFKSLDLAGNAGSNSGITGYTLDTTAPTTTVSGVDISNDTGASNTDFITNAAAQTITGTLSTNLLANETLKVSMDGGDTWTGINASVSGTAISYATTLTGNASMVFRIFDDAGNFGSYQGWTTIIFDTTPPALTVTTNSLSVDAGTSASDFITNTATQTITATLSGALSAGDTIRGSVNGYTTKADITTKVSGTTITWDGATLVSGTNDIVFRVRDAAGNDSTNLGTKSYTLDTTAPTITALYVHSSNGKVGNYLNTGDYFYTAATFSEPVSVSGTPQAGVTVGSTVYQSNYFLTISPEIYFVHTIAAGENDSDGVSFQSNAITLNGGSVIDTAGNGANLAHAPAADNPAYLVDTAIAAPTIALTSDTGTSSTDKITNNGALTLTGVEAGAAVEYSLNGTSGWAASFTATSGANTVYVRQTDAAGNMSVVSPAFTFNLVTAAPTQTISNVSISNDDGNSSSDFITSIANQTVTAALSSALSAGDYVQVSVNGGATYATANVSGASVTANVTLQSGTNSLVFRVVNQFAQAGNQTGIINYTLLSSTLSSIFISAPGTASVCSGANVTVQMRDAGGTAITGYTGSISLSSSNASVAFSLVSGNGSMSGGVYTFAASDNGSASFKISSNRKGSLTMTGASGAVSGTSGVVNFADSVFVVDSVDAFGNDVVAGRNHEFRASLYKSADGSACGVDTTYSGVKSVKLWKSNAAAAHEVGNTTFAAGIYLPSAMPGSENANLTFTNGVTSFSMATNGVGRYSLSVLDNDVGVDELGLPVAALGESVVFGVRPFAIRTTLSKSSIPASTATTAAGSAFVSAGTDFDVALQLVGYDAADDANSDGLPDGHGDADIANDVNLSNNAAITSGPLSVSLDSALALPTSGHNPGLSGNTTIAISNGAGAGQIAFDDVGIVQIVASMSNALESGIDVSSKTTPVRIKADHLAVVAQPAELDDGHGTCEYTYQAEEFDYAVNPELALTAKSALGSTLQNYTGDFWKYSAPSTIAATSTKPETATAEFEEVNDAEVVYLQDNEHGIGALITAGKKFKFAKSVSPTLGDGPFTPTVTLALTAEDLTDADGACYKTTSSCEGLDIAATGTEIRWGRLQLEAAHTDKSVDGTIKIQPTYFDGFALGSYHSVDESACYQQDFDAADITIPYAIGGIVAADITITSVTGTEIGVSIKDTASNQAGKAHIELATLDFWKVSDDDIATLKNPKGSVYYKQYKGDVSVFGFREIYRGRD